MGVEQGPGLLRRDVLIGRRVGTLEGQGVLKIDFGENPPMFEDEIFPFIQTTEDRKRISPEDHLKIIERCLKESGYAPKSRLRDERDSNVYYITLGSVSLNA